MEGRNGEGGIKTLTYGLALPPGYNASMILSDETREHVSAGGAGLEHPPRQDTRTFFQGSALNYGNYLDEVWVIDKRSGGVSVADLNDGTGSDRHFYHQNTLYHVYALTDETGAIAEAVQSYDAYGKISALITGSGSDTTWFTADDVTATNPNVSTIGNTFFYTGQRVDPETGLYYYKNRYYSAELGRFVSRWPPSKNEFGLEFVDDIDLSFYQYQYARPTFMPDPLGDPTGAEEAAAVGIAASEGVAMTAGAAGSLVIGGGVVTGILVDRHSKGPSAPCSSPQCTDPAPNSGGKIGKDSFGCKRALRHAVKAAGTDCKTNPAYPPCTGTCAGGKKCVRRYTPVSFYDGMVAVWACYAEVTYLCPCKCR